MYNSGVVFYGLGNFIFQHEDVDYLPENFTGNMVKQESK